MQMHEQKYINPTIGTIIGGIAAGSAVNYITGIPCSLICTQINKNIQTANNSIGADVFSKAEKAIVDTIKNSGLEAKGVSLLKVNPQNIDEISKMLIQDMDNCLLGYLPKTMKEKYAKSITEQLKEGENSFYTFVSKKIIVPEKGHRLTIFHELGHAMNANLSKLGKFLQNCRFIAKLSLPITIIALLKTKKAQGEEPKNKLDKATTFIKNNAGKLTFISFLPMVLEEGLASLKGNKVAKRFLSPELASKIAKLNMLAFSTYLLFAIFSSLGVYLGTKVKDNIASRKVATQNS